MMPIEATEADEFSRWLSSRSLSQLEAAQSHVEQKLAELDEIVRASRYFLVHIKDRREVLSQT